MVPFCRRRRRRCADNDYNNTQADTHTHTHTRARGDNTFSERESLLSRASVVCMSHYYIICIYTLYYIFVVSIFLIRSFPSLPLLPFTETYTVPIRMYSRTQSSVILLCAIATLLFFSGAQQYTHTHTNSHMCVCYNVVVSTCRYSVLQV